MVNVVSLEYRMWCKEQQIMYYKSTEGRFEAVWPNVPAKVRCICQRCMCG